LPSDDGCYQPKHVKAYTYKYILITLGGVIEIILIGSDDPEENL
jgi:hypothetical protein